MLIKIMKKDLVKKKALTTTIFIFIMLSSLLAVSGFNMIVELVHSLDALYVKSEAPHIVQMHAGEINEEELDSFSANNKHVSKNQIVEMINIDEAHLDFGSDFKKDGNNIMDHYFVKQNESFDFLLNLDSEIIHVTKGEIAVPIYHMQQKNIQIGDKVNITTSEIEMEFKVVDFVRDVQMNPSIIHSKRFLINDDDFNLLKNKYNEMEYLIEFQLNDLKKISDVTHAYQSANLPQKGPVIDYHLFKMLHAMTDGVVAVVILFVSILLVVMAILCLRFIILAAMEEDFREIGVMKAIGINLQHIKNIYLFKYVILAASASLSGYVLSLFFNQLFTRNILLYIGTAPKSLIIHMLPFIPVIIIFLFVLFICQLTLRKFNKITAVEALRTSHINEKRKRRKSLLSFRNNYFFNVHYLLSLTDIFTRFKMYSLLLFVFVICTFIIIVPINFLNTVQSPDFIKYMGIEKSDLRIDLHSSDHIEEEFDKIISYIQNDKDVQRYSPLVTNQFKVVNSDGIVESLIVEPGDFSIFELEYLAGSAPVQENEIALSYLNSKEFQKHVDDPLTLFVNGQKKPMVVSGIYQDVTNGGRTAKALLPASHERALRYEVSLDVKQGKNIDEIRKEYARAFDSAKVTHLKDYLSETFGNTVHQLKIITMLAIGIALIVSILITSLFLTLIIAKDSSQIALMKSIGFSLSDLRLQYVIRTLLVLVSAIIIGTILSNTAGQSLASGLLSVVGATKVQFVIHPFYAYIVCPLLLILSVVVTTIINITSIKNVSIVELNAEG